MKLNREKSRLITGIVTLTLVGGISIGSLTLYENVKTKDDSTIINDTKQQEFMHNYYRNVENPNIDLFDQNFIELCHNGKLIINEKEYNLKDIYIVKGKSSENEYVYLQDYHEPTINILTGNELPSDFKRDKIMQFTYSNTFYNYYQNNKSSNNVEVNNENIDEFIEYVNSFDATYNDNLPETYYYVHPKVYKSK